MPKIIHLEYTDDGCDLYVYTCCKERLEARSYPGEYCPYCGAHVGAVQEADTSRTRYFRYVERPSWQVTLQYPPVTYPDGYVEQFKADVQTAFSRKQAAVLLRLTRKHEVLDDMLQMYSEDIADGRMPEDDPEILEHVEDTKCMSFGRKNPIVTAKKVVA